MFDRLKWPCAFLETNYEKFPVHIPDVIDPTAFGWKVLDEALQYVEPGSGEVKLINGSRLEQHQFAETYRQFSDTRTRFFKEILDEQLSNGATLVVNKMERYSTAVSDLCKCLSSLVSANISANAYASRGGEPATNVHWDTHDVFAVQLIGAKKWELFRPTIELPLHNQKSDDQKALIKDRQADMTIILEEGSILYLPRGWWHRVSPLHDRQTLHLAAGIHPPLMLDYIIWLCAKELHKSVQHRRSIVGRISEDGLIEEAASNLSHLMKTDEVKNRFIQSTRQRVRFKSNFSVGNIMRQELAEFLPYTRLVSHAINGPVDGQVWAQGKMANLDPTESKIVETIITNPAISVGELERTYGDVDFKVVLPRLASMDIIAVIGAS